MPTHASMPSLQPQPQSSLHRSRMVQHAFKFARCCTGRPSFETRYFVTLWHGCFKFADECYSNSSLFASVANLAWARRKAAVVARLFIG